MSSYDRTNERFIVLLARREAEKEPNNLTISLPAKIQHGSRYNRDKMFTGEGFAAGEQIRVRWTTEDVTPTTGYRKNSKYEESSLTVDSEGQLTFNIPAAQRLTTLVFERK